MEDKAKADVAWRYVPRPGLLPNGEPDYSHLDAPPPHARNPRDIAHSIARVRRASRLREDAQVMQQAARIARFHGCPAVDNACASLARTLADEADKVHKTTKDVTLKPEYKDKL